MDNIEVLETKYIERLKSIITLYQGCIVSYSQANQLLLDELLTFIELCYQLDRYKILPSSEYQHLADISANLYLQYIDILEAI